MSRPSHLTNRPVGGKLLVAVLAGLIVTFVLSLPYWRSEHCLLNPPPGFDLEGTFTRQELNFFPPGVRCTYTREGPGERMLKESSEALAPLWLLIIPVTVGVLVYRSTVRRALV